MVSEALESVWKELPESVRLVAVSKFHPAEAIQAAYEAGQRIFGESHVQEMVAKVDVLPQDIEWHFIGHLQTNKVKYLAQTVSLIHAVDSLKLLREIDKQAAKAGRTIRCLLELHVAQEESKYGFSPDELIDLMAGGEWRELNHVSICGLMTMATFTDDTHQIRREFQLARKTFERVKAEFFANDSNFCELSMGMSHDYPIAVEEGATLVRIGTKIFGERVY